MWNALYSGEPGSRRGGDWEILFVLEYDIICGRY